MRVAFDKTERFSELGLLPGADTPLTITYIMSAFDPEMELICSVRDGDLKVVCALLENHSYSDDWLERALHVAALWGWGQIAFHIMNKYHFDSQVLRRIGKSACERGFSSCGNMIKAWTAGDGPMNPFSPPAFRTITGFVSVYDVDPAKLDTAFEVRSAFHAAAKYGHDTLLHKLINHEELRQEDKDGAFLVAMWGGRTRIVKYMLKNVNISGDSIWRGRAEAERRHMDTCIEAVNEHMNQTAE